MRPYDLLSDSLGSRRFNTYVLISFAAIALVLACVGLFGVLAYVVAQRTRDIGVRIALGASRSDVFRLIVGRGMMLAGIGGALGILAGLGAARLMRSLLFAVAPNDPLTFTLVPVIVILVALLACFGPAERATRVDSLTALRAEWGVETFAPRRPTDQLRWAHRSGACRGLRQGSPPPDACHTCPSCGTTRATATLRTPYGAYCHCPQSGHLWHDEVPRDTEPQTGVLRRRKSDPR